MRVNMESFQVFYFHQRYIISFNRIKENDDDCGSGWKRLREMYTFDDSGLLSPQLRTVSIIFVNIIIIIIK